MNPAVARPGRSFKGLIAYLTHDPDHAKTDERVDFVMTRNLRTNDPEKAAKVMAWTALHADDLKRAAGEKTTGRKMKNPVYHFIQTWSKEEAPSHSEMMRWVDRALQEMQLEEHETVIVGHNDSEHHQIHVAVNRVHPVHGTSPSISNDYNRLQAIAYEYEKARGKVLCPARIAKFEKDPELRRAGRKALQARRAAEKAGTMPKKSKARPVWERDKAARQATLDRQAALDALQQDRELYRAVEIEPPHDPVKETEAFKAQQAQDTERVRTARDKQTQEAQRQKFEEWETRQRNSLQDRQLEERGIVGRQWAQRRLEIEGQIEEQYGKSKLQDEKRLAVLAQKHKNGSWLSRFVGRSKGEHNEREALQKNLADIERRSQEMLGQVESRRRDAFAFLDQQHKQQRQELEEQIEKGRKEDYAIPISGRDRGSREPGQGHGRNFHSRGRNFS